MSEDNSIAANVQAALGQALTVFLKPASVELGEILAARIRLYRWKSALKVLEKATQIAKERHLDTRNIPAKFLVPFIERTSLEDEDSELIEKWANLLANSASSYSEIYNVYCNLLGSIGSKSSKMLERIVSNDTLISLNGEIVKSKDEMSYAERRKFYTAQVQRRYLQEGVARNQKVMASYTSRASARARGTLEKERKWVQRQFKEMTDIFLPPGGIIKLNAKDYMLSTNSFVEVAEFEPTLNAENVDALTVLENFKLVEVYNEYNSDGSGAKWFELTSLGLGLVYACRGYK